MPFLCIFRQNSCRHDALRNIRRVRNVTVICTLVALLGCASGPVAEPDGALVRHYLGYVKVVVPRAAARIPVYTSDITVLGIRVGGGMGIGYARDRQIVVPLDCRLVLLVATQAQLNAALDSASRMFDNPNSCAVMAPFLASGESP